MHEAQIPHSIEPRNIFTDVINHANIGDDSTARSLKAINPDILAKNTLIDIKHANASIGTYSAKNVRTKQGAVNFRAYTARKEYTTHARKIDRDNNGANEAEIGPVENKLNSFGRLEVPVWGAFGEGSKDAHDMIHNIAEAIATEKWRGLNYDNMKACRGMYKRIMYKEFSILIGRETSILRKPTG